MIRAVIFDIDGTLIDSVDDHARAWVDAFAHFGKSVGFPEARMQIGKGGDQLLPVFLDPSEIERFGEELSDWRGEHLRKTYLANFRPFPGVRELFQRLLDDGKQIALATSAKAEELERYKKIAGIADLVHPSKQASSDDAERSKPHPDIFQAALGKLDGISAAEAVAIGDTPYDAEAATKAGIKTVGVLCGGFPEGELRRAGCYAIYKDPADLLERADFSRDFLPRD